MNDINPIDKAFPNGLDAISKCFGLSQALVRIKGPRSLRLALDVSQPEMGRLLGFYIGGRLGGRAYSSSTIATWERVERHVRLPGRYAMTDKARDAYCKLLADVVNLASADQLWLRAEMGPRVWRFRLQRRCVVCERSFILRRAGQVRCMRCIRSKRR